MTGARMTRCYTTSWDLTARRGRPRCGLVVQEPGLLTRTSALTPVALRSGGHRESRHGERTTATAVEEHVHEHTDPTPAAARPAATLPSQGVGHDEDHSLLWMVVCCAPMVLFLVVIALGWFALR